MRLLPLAVMIAGAADREPAFDRVEPVAVGRGEAEMILSELAGIKRRLRLPARFPVRVRSPRPRFWLAPGASAPLPCRLVGRRVPRSHKPDRAPAVHATSLSSRPP